MAGSAFYSPGTQSEKQEAPSSSSTWFRPIGHDCQTRPPTPSPSTSTTTADPTPSPPRACTKEFCASRAAEMDLPFQSVHKSNGAPRGCVKYRQGVAWVRNCVNHPNCGTTNCNGCEVIAACPAPEPIADTTYNPTLEPTINPTVAPTINPSVNPTMNPTVNPTMNPSVNP